VAVVFVRVSLGEDCNRAEYLGVGSISMGSMVNGNSLVD